jgi:two-component system LytT family response regulator
LKGLVIKAGGRIYFLDTNEIDWIEAEGNYVSVHTAKKSHLLRETIGSLEAQLDPKKICSHPSLLYRAHRQHSRTRTLVPW